MDWRLVGLFLLIGGWLYVAVLLAAADWRWNLGRIVQALLFSGFAVEALLDRRDSIAWLGTAVALFLLSLPGALLCQRCIARNLLGGRLRRARFWMRLCTILTWTRHPGARSAGERIAALVRDRVPDPGERRHYLPLVLSALAAPTRAHLVASEIEALAVLQDYPGALSLYDAHPSSTVLREDPEVLYAVAVACAEIGDLKRSIEIFRQADAVSGGGQTARLRRLVAWIRILAYAGRPEAVERVLAGSASLLPMLPAAFPHLWRGVARLRAGETAAALADLRRALAKVPPGESLMRQKVEAHLRIAESGFAGPPPALDEETARSLLALEAASAPGVPLEGVAGGEPFRARVTWCFILLCVLSWLLMWPGVRGTEGFALMRFGANVPSLVRHGEWWRLVSSIFVHAGWLHLLFNCYACYIFGRFVERIAGGVGFIHAVHRVGRRRKRGECVPGVVRHECRCVGCSVRPVGRGARAGGQVAQHAAADEKARHNALVAFHRSVEHEFRVLRTAR